MYVQAFFLSWRSKLCECSAVSAALVHSFFFSDCFLAYCLRIIKQKLHIYDCERLGLHLSPSGLLCVETRRGRKMYQYLHFLYIPPCRTNVFGMNCLVLKLRVRPFERWVLFRERAQLYFVKAVFELFDLGANGRCSCF